MSGRKPREDDNPIIARGVELGREVAQLARAVRGNVLVSQQGSTGSTMMTVETARKLFAPRMNDEELAAFDAGDVVVLADGLRLEVGI